MFRKLTKIAALIGVCAAPFSAHAIAFTLNGPNTIGSIVSGTETPTAANAAYINALLYRNNNNTTTSPYDQLGKTYSLLNDSGTTLPPADPAGIVDKGGVGGDDKVNVTGFEYLIVKYGGDHGTAVVFNVANITGNVFVPQKDSAGATHNKYLLFNAAGTTTANVPDGGATAMLVGIGLLGLGAFRQKPS